MVAIAAAVAMFDASKANRREPRIQPTVALNPELRAALETRAREERRSLSAQVNYFVTKALATEPRKGGVSP
jgi:hypothetical protein